MKQLSEVEGQWYDVCNDHSLDPCEQPNLIGYTDSLFLVNGKNIVVYTHKKFNEIHYAYGPKGLKHQIIKF